MTVADVAIRESEGAENQDGDHSDAESWVSSAAFLSKNVPALQRGRKDRALLSPITDSDFSAILFRITAALIGQEVGPGKLEWPPTQPAVPRRGSIPRVVRGRMACPTDPAPIAAAAFIRRCR